jgi:hypothetical protein
MHFLKLLIYIGYNETGPLACRSNLAESQFVLLTVPVLAALAHLLP